MFRGTAESVVADTKRLIEEARAMQDKMVADVKLEEASFENVMRPMAYEENNAGLTTHVLGFYQAVSTDKELRDASTEADKLLTKFSIESSMREDVYKLVDAAFSKGEKLDPESHRLLEKERKEYIRNGLGLPAGPKRDKFKEIKQRLAQISIEFQKNLKRRERGSLVYSRRAGWRTRRNRVKPQER